MYRQSSQSSSDSNGGWNVNKSQDPVNVFESKRFIITKENTFFQKFQYFRALIIHLYFRAFHFLYTNNTPTDIITAI